MCPTQVSQDSYRARVSAAVGPLHDCQRFRKESDGFRRLTQSNVQNSTVIQRKSRLRVLRAEYLATEFKSPPTRRPGRLIVLAGIGNDEQVLVGPDEFHIWMVGGAVSRGQGSPKEFPGIGGAAVVQIQTGQIIGNRRQRFAFCFRRAFVYGKCLKIVALRLLRPAYMLANRREGVRSQCHSRLSGPILAANPRARLNALSAGQ